MRGGLSEALVVVGVAAGVVALVVAPGQPGAVGGDGALGVALALAQGPATSPGLGGAGALAGRLLPDLDPTAAHAWVAAVGLWLGGCVAYLGLRRHGARPAGASTGAALATLGPAALVALSMGQLHLLGLPALLLVGAGGPLGTGLGLLVAGAGGAVLALPGLVFAGAMVATGQARTPHLAAAAVASLALLGAAQAGWVAWGPGPAPQLALAGLGTLGVAVAMALRLRFGALWTLGPLGVVMGSALVSVPIPLPRAAVQHTAAVQALAAPAPGESDGLGAILDLPLDVLGGPPTRGALHATWLLLARLHHRPLLHGPEPLGTDVLLQEPLVVLVLDAMNGQGAWLVPERSPGSVLLALGVRRVVLHRDELDATALALVDPILRKALDPPMRDLAAAVDIYPLPASEQPPPLPQPASLQRADQGPVQGWLTVTEYLEAWR